jgi:hypothetical protein
MGFPLVMPGLVPGIHVFKVSYTKDVDGIRNSGLPELRKLMVFRKSDISDLR